MTADERIEKLLNRFGQTIEDLPTEYHFTHCIHAKDSALDWVMRARDEIPDNKKIYSEYICHLADVIDRMEIALETAANNCGCDFCEKQVNDCKIQPNNEEFVCDYRIADELLY